MFNEQHKKERPVLGLLGMGGGIARGGGAAPVPISSSGGNTSAGVAPGNTRSRTIQCFLFILPVLERAL